MWIILGWVLVFGIPAAVIVAVIFWPEHIQEDRTVEAIRKRIEDEDG